MLLGNFSRKHKDDSLYNEADCSVESIASVLCWLRGGMRRGQAGAFRPKPCLKASVETRWRVAAVSCHVASGELMQWMLPSGQLHCIRGILLHFKRHLGQSTGSQPPR